jgi:type VI secretion system protein ImpF
MPQKQKHDRFVPPIMYAFREAFRTRDAEKDLSAKNEAGEAVIAGRRSSPRSAVSDTALRQELADDLTTLLNTVNLAAAQDIESLEHVRRSILNFGVPDLTRITVDDQVAVGLSKSMIELLQRYEPRLVADTIHIKQEARPDDASGLIRFHVTADMISTPVDIAVEFIADIEAGSGKMKVSRT